MDTKALDGELVWLESQSTPTRPPSTPCSLPSLEPLTPLKDDVSDSSSPLSPPPLLSPSPDWSPFRPPLPLSQSDPFWSPPQLPVSIPTPQTPQHSSPPLLGSSSPPIPPPPEKTRFLQVHRPRGNDFDAHYLIARFPLGIRIWIGTRSGVQVARIEFETTATATQVLAKQGGEGGGWGRVYSLYAERVNEENRWWEQEGITCTDVKSYCRPPKYSRFWSRAE